MSTYQMKTVDVRNQTEIQRYKSSLKWKKEKTNVAFKQVNDSSTYADA